MSGTKEIREDRARRAVAEAKRFVKRAEEFVKSGYDGMGPSPSHAAMIRASMDLSRVLSELRSNPWKEQK